MKDRIKKMKQAAKLAFEGIRELFGEPRLYIILACVFFFLRKEYANEINGLNQMQLTLGIWEIWPYAETNLMRSLIIKIGFIGIISDIPREGDRMVSYLFRAGKKVFLRSQQIYIIAVAVLYTLFVQLCCVSYYIPYLETQKRWSVFTRQYIVESLNAPARICYQTTPFAMHMFAAVLFLCALMILGFLMLFFNMCVSRRAGCIAAAALVGFDIIIQWIQRWFMKYMFLNWLSPLSWCRLSGIDLGYNHELPGNVYITGMIFLILIVFAVGTRMILAKHDFQKGGKS